MAEAMERQAAGQAHARLAESAVTQAEALARRHAGERERLERERAALGVDDGAAARLLETEAEAARLGDEIARLTDSLAAIDSEREQAVARREAAQRSEEHTSELQSLMRISYAVFCLKKQT